ncbi:hypothetical protein HUO13_33150 [Saccharopolyspora erythraea]|uniref:hypothetical protein n=1 Tax=Saccharopolyspora erythraea TaxID=1836 RepID=UPI001BA4E1EF|nr:hypothetical protein [Saccharopolyspora erythraea]QUH04986.1 hypothetical protein HUO13_33150 [Saccharopolyspora erythraea]
MRTRRALTYLAAWLAATTAAVTLSWLGVRDVIRGAVLDRPDPVPAVRPVIEHPPQPTTPPASAPPESAAPETSAPEPAPESSSRDPVPSPAGDVRTYDVGGGHVVLSMGATSASLVSATPKPGYSVRTWTAQGWLRVEFGGGAHGTSVIVTWHDHPPLVEVSEY